MGDDSDYTVPTDYTAMIQGVVRGALGSSLRELVEFVLGHQNIPHAHVGPIMDHFWKGRDVDRPFPEWCNGAERPEYCCADWISARYWRWRAGEYVPFSQREFFATLPELSNE